MHKFESPNTPALPFQKHCNC